MIISAIAAHANNRAIGKDNDLPWNLPADMKYFMRTTRGHHVLMGRKTYESMGVPLKNRTNIVLTRDPYFVGSNLVVVHSLQEGIDYAKANGESELFIIGGAQIYKQSLPHLDQLYITEIDLDVPDGDVFFPKIDLKRWDLVSEIEHAPDEKNPYPFIFKIYKKKATIWASWPKRGLVKNCSTMSGV